MVRATAVNSNGHTNGITLPSIDGQEAVIRKAYAKAALDVNDTHYVEVSKCTTTTLFSLGYGQANAYKKLQKLY